MLSTIISFCVRLKLIQEQVQEKNFFSCIEMYKPAQAICGFQYRFKDFSFGLKFWGERVQVGFWQKI